MGNYFSTETPEPVKPEEEANEAASVIQNVWKKKEQGAEFKWPDNLYLELMDMAETDQMVGYVALLFKAAREAKEPFKGLQSIVGLSESAPNAEKPKLTLAQIQSIVEDNKEALSKSAAFSDVTTPQDMLDALTKISNRTSGRKLAIVNLNPVELARGDMPYAIVKDDKLKRITVAFNSKNSALKSDWILQRSYRQRNVKLPRALKAKISGDRITHVKQHEGFSLYLTRGGVNSLSNQIINDLLPVLTPKYKLYVTGHGMAGALATLLAFHVAFDSTIPTPVSCVTLGSPRVGDASFWRASYLLEISGKLRTCRIVTDSDTLPTIPASKDYAHAGYQLRLSPSSKLVKPQEYYPAVKDDGSLRKPAFQSTKKFNASKSDPQTYLECIEMNQEALVELDLNELYKQAGVDAFSAADAVDE